MIVRINKYLSNAGYCSRRQADKYLQEGRVRINGEIANLGSSLDTENDTITVDGNSIKNTVEKIYLKMYKPVGIECTTNTEIKDNIIDYMKYKSRIYPIGRLDKNSEGLILLTNDGSIVNPILKGSNFKEKEYIVTLDKDITDGQIKILENGVPILGQTTRKCKIRRINSRTVNIVLTQGLNRQIRRMCQYIGINVVNLKRIRIINIGLGNLKIGEYTNLSKKEVEELYKIVNYG